MWTTRFWKLTVLCGWLTAPLAGASPVELDEVPGDARAAADSEAAYTEGAPDEMGGAVDESQFFMEDPESVDAPVLRFAER